MTTFFVTLGEPFYRTRQGVYTNLECGIALLNDKFKGSQVRIVILDMEADGKRYLVGYLPNSVDISEQQVR